MDWKRFHTYAARVQQLRYTPRVPVSRRDLLQPRKPISREVLKTVAHYRTRLEVLPNLRSLVWLPMDPSPHLYDAEHLTWKDVDACLFMHQRITSFKAYIPEFSNTRNYRSRFMADIPRRLPNLTKLHLTSRIRATDIDTDLACLVSDLKNLEDITLSPFYLTSAVAVSLAPLTRLKVIDVTSTSLCLHTCLNVPGFSLTVPMGSFAGLRRLSLFAYYEDVATFLGNPVGLHSLTVDSEHILETARSLHTLLSAVCNSIPQLQDLSLICIQDPSFVSRHLDLKLDGESGHDHENGVINLETLRPALLLSNLTSFKIDHARTLDLSIADISLIAASMPQIETLVLNVGQINFHEARFGLEVLLAVGGYCKRLKHFGVFLDATRPINSLSSTRISSPWSKARSHRRSPAIRCLLPKHARLTHLHGYRLARALSPKISCKRSLCSCHLFYPLKLSTTSNLAGIMEASSKVVRFLLSQVSKILIYICYCVRSEFECGAIHF